MARSLSTTNFLAVMLMAALSTGAYAAACGGQILDFTYDRCIDLPHLGSFLHYTYNPVNTSISIAFIAKPATSSGWVAWGINPVGPQMVGTQAFVSYVADGVVSVYTYNVSGKTSSAVKQGPLSFDTWDVSGQSFGWSGEYLIYAKAKVPVESQTTLAHVWQIGPSVDGTSLGVHGFNAENLVSFDTIDLIGASVAPASSPTNPDDDSPLGGLPASSPSDHDGSPLGGLPASSPSDHDGSPLGGSPASSPSNHDNSPLGGLPADGPIPFPVPRVNLSPHSSPSSGSKACGPTPFSALGLGIRCAIAALVSFSFVVS